MESLYRSIRRSSTRASNSILLIAISKCSAIFYRKYHPTKGPEARLFSACLAVVLFPVGMFIYGWCAFPHVPWIGMAIGILVSSATALVAAAAPLLTFRFPR